MDGSISYKKMEELLEYQISHHTNAIVVAGTTGESACLSDEEHLRLIQFSCQGGQWKFFAACKNHFPLS